MFPAGTSEPLPASPFAKGEEKEKKGRRKKRGIKWRIGIMTEFYNKKSEQTKRRKLRFNATLAEKILWMSLRKRQILGVRFLRQYSIDKFVMDFYSPEIKLCIEVDGESHIGREEYDAARQKYIEYFNIKVIRYNNEQILGNPNKTVESIEDSVRERVKVKI